MTAAAMAMDACTRAFTAAHEAYAHEVHTFVRAYMRDDHDAADVSAEVWADIWRGLPTFRGDATLRTWVYTIARNTCARHRARTPRRREAALSEARTSQLVHNDPTSPSPTETRRARLAAFRAELSDDDQAVLVLRVDRALGWDDVGHILGCSAACARKRFERIKQRLRDRLEVDGWTTRNA
jgi:RNA polymerase sigma-70 factor (ECF subfamily)